MRNSLSSATVKAFARAAGVALVGALAGTAHGQCALSFGTVFGNDTGNTTSSTKMLIFDLDGDGFNDVLLLRSGGYTVLRGPAVSHVSPMSVTSGSVNGGTVSGVAFGDYDGNGTTAAFFSLDTTSANSISIIRNTGTMISGGAQAMSNAATPNAKGIAVADLNGDSRVDVVTINAAAGATTGVVSVSMRIGTGHPPFFAGAGRVRRAVCSDGDENAGH